MAYSLGPQPPAQDCVCWEMLAHRTLASLFPGVESSRRSDSRDGGSQGPGLSFSGTHHLTLKLGKLLRLHYPPIIREPHQLHSCFSLLFALVSLCSRPVFVLTSQQKRSWGPCRQTGVKVRRDTQMPGAEHWGAEKAGYFIPGNGLVGPLCKGEQNRVVQRVEARR